MAKRNLSLKREKSPPNGLRSKKGNLSLKREKCPKGNLKSFHQKQCIAAWCFLKAGLEQVATLKIKNAINAKSGGYL